MNFAAVQPIADAVLYEGYLLYPYRLSSVKNRQRWTFGRLFPKGCAEVQRGAEACSLRAESLVLGGAGTAISARIRFLQLVERRHIHAGEISENCQEAVAREFDIAEILLEELLRAAVAAPFTFPAAEEAVDGITRWQDTVAGEVRLAATPVGEGAYRVAIEIVNLSACQAGPHAGPGEARLDTLASTHVILGVHDGQFVSLVDPPGALREAAASSRQAGAWPVLVGDPARCDMVLISPIIFEDFPRIAPESAGDLFDATEIDEILTLRIVTLADDEKQALRAGDDRARRLLERTEALTAEQLLALHGRMTHCRTGFTARPETDRFLKYGIGILDPPQFPDNAGGCGVSDPLFEPTTHGQAERLVLQGLRPGRRVRLRPGGGADAFDVLLHGKSATIQSVEQDFEGRTYLCVTVDDDPGRDLGAAGQPGHRFFFRPDEVEPLEDFQEVLP